MRVVGLSGGISCGKSSVTRMLQAEGISVIDCDKIAHEAVRKGSWGYRRVVKVFGPDILTKDGDIDRERLGKIVFSDTKKRRQLNAATHLPVALTILGQLLYFWLRCKALVVVDMPLLFETGSHRWTSLSVAVTCGAEQQVERLMARDGSSRVDALARISSQMPLERKKAMAGIVLDNSADLAHLQLQVDGLVKRMRRGAWAWGLVTSPLMLITAVVGSRFLLAAVR